MTERSGGERRILLVEDFFMVAEIYKSLLTRLSYRVVGPAPSVETALTLLEQEEVDGAVLDVTLNGQLVTPVAHRLRELELPFVFLTAVANLNLLPKELQSIPLARKPVTEERLRQALRDAGL